MKKIIFISLAIFLTSCMSFNEIAKGTSQSDIDSIPKGATKIIVENDKSMQENYIMSYQTLISQNFKIEKSNKEMGYILANNTEPGDTRMRLNIICKDNTININVDWSAGTQTGAMISAMGMYPGSFTWYHAKWAKNNTKSTTAFLYAFKFAQKLGGIIKFE